MINFLVLGGVVTGLAGAAVAVLEPTAVPGLLVMLIGAVLFAGGGVAQEIRYLRPPQ